MTSSIVLTTSRNLFERVLTIVVITLLAAPSVIVLMGVFYRKMGWRY